MAKEIMLTEHFSLEELTRSELAERKGWDNKPSLIASANLIRLAEFLEQVRKVIGKPLVINSGYRSQILNNAVGSKETSQHRVGCAADFRVGGMTPREICEIIKNSDLQFDQCIQELSWVHISIPSKPNETPRGQMLIIDSKGTRPYATNA